MDRNKSLKNCKSIGIFKQLIMLHHDLDQAFISQFNRSLPFNEEIFDRWKRAEELGFGKESSIYDSSLVFGKVKVGSYCWIGPFTIIDGSGGLKIGNYCTISVGVHIYSHDNINRTLSSGRIPIDRKPVTIGNNNYIGPYTIITKGISIGNYCIIGAYSLINKNVPDYSFVIGQPGIIRGRVIIKKDEVKIKYLKKNHGK